MLCCWVTWRQAYSQAYRSVEGLKILAKIMAKKHQKSEKEKRKEKVPGMRT